MFFGYQSVGGCSARGARKSMGAAAAQVGLLGVVDSKVFDGTPVFASRMEAKTGFMGGSQPRFSRSLHRRAFARPLASSIIRSTGAFSLTARPGPYRVPTVHAMRIKSHTWRFFTRRLSLSLFRAHRRLGAKSEATCSTALRRSLYQAGVHGLTNPSGAPPRFAYLSTINAPRWCGDEHRSCAKTRPVIAGVASTSRRRTAVAAARSVSELGVMLLSRDP